ncbi:hypothetical protein QE152_g33049 [Popillia japonica]|uniref:Uncharacterized protein n=1 Tax=Popillia japonica TaxID=7064 RepID=A0AAW1IYP7_POPJA
MLTIELVILFISVALISIVKTISEIPKPPIFNIYQRPTRTYWLKVAFMYVILKLRQIKNNIREERLRAEGKNKYVTLDGPQKLSSDEKAVDAVFFNGANGKGDHFIIATARRKNRLIDGFVYLKLHDSKLGLLESPKLPSTELYQTTEKQAFEAEGISISVVEPMKCWKIKYNGKMKSRDDRVKMYDVTVEAEFTSDQPCFNVDTDMDPLLTAKATALEPWSREYFQTLQKIHQTHYEQYGNIRGSAIINGVQYPIDVNVLRDHSVGHKREWRNFHRYALHFINVENGDRLTVGVISTPISFSHFTMGFAYSAKERKVYPLSSCDLLLHQHGESGDPPLDYGFTVKAGSNTYVIKVHITDSPHFYISKDWEAKIYERLCRYTVNNLKGWGAVEWQYRNVRGKDVEDHIDINNM